MNNASFQTSTKQGIVYFSYAMIVWAIIGGVIWFLKGNIYLFEFFNHSNTPFLDQVMPYATFLGEGGVVVALLLTPIIFFKKFRTKRYVLAAILANGVPSLVVQIIKQWINAPRPLTYYTDPAFVQQIAGQPQLYHKSFPSGHTQAAFALMLFLSALLPASKSILAFWGFGIALAVGYSRMYLGHHFYEDVYVGSLLGYAFAFISLKIYPPVK